MISHVVVEGLPAVGKSETLALLSSFYPRQVSVLPELVKQTAIREKIDILSERSRLTEALVAAVNGRKEEIERAKRGGKLCLEESHLGVHLAYAKALNDDYFISAYDTISSILPTPDLYVRLEAPVELSIERQKARNTPAFYVDNATLRRFLSYLDNWHEVQKTGMIRVDADRPPSLLLSDVERALKLCYPAPIPREAVFDILLLLGRPASGKSEFIDFMKSCPISKRLRRYHIAEFRVVDDFPILWEKFKEDDLWENLGRPRLHSRPTEENYAVTDSTVWSFLIGKVNEQVLKLGDEEKTPCPPTTIIEFARGGEHGYRESLSRLSPILISRSAIIYFDVSFEESKRRNLTRFKVERKSEILTHSVPSNEMAETYRQDDWHELAPSERGTIDAGGFPVPYVTMSNEPESADPRVLESRYTSALDQLYGLFPTRLSSR